MSITASSVLSAAQTSSAPSSTSTTDNTSSQLTLKTFISLLVAEMEHQDPTQPMKDTDYLNQLTNLGTLSGLDNLNRTTSIDQATSLIGKTVTASSSADNAVNGSISGTVTKVAVRSGTYYVTLHNSATNQDTEVQLKTIETVQ